MQNSGATQKCFHPVYSTRLCAAWALALVLSSGALASEPDLAYPAKNSYFPSIVGGVDVAPSDPVSQMTVLLQGYGVCTGVLIAKDLLLTAGHCVTTQWDVRVPASQLQVKFSIDRNDPKAKTATVLGIAVPDAFTMKNYMGGPDIPKNLHDIALVRFSGGLPEGYKAARILKKGGNVAAGQAVIVAGYGTTIPGSSFGAGRLRKAELKMEDFDYSPTEVRLDSSHGSSDCNGDSGGPAFVVIQERYYLIGVDNWGPPSCNDFSIYARAGAHWDWISQASDSLRAIQPSESQEPIPAPAQP